MAAESGGWGGKSGNEFEALYVSRLLLQLLTDHATSVTLEPPDQVATGIECYADRPDGTRQFHQCKRENKSKGYWSVSDLQHAGVLTNAKTLLTAHPTAHFVFASGDKASELRALHERALQYSDPSELVQFGLSNKTLREDFTALETALDLSRDDPAQLTKLLDFLRRFHPTVVEPLQQRDEAEWFASLVFAGSPRVAVQALCTVASTRFRTTFTSAALLREPALKDLQLSDVRKDVSLPHQFDLVNERFHQSIAPLLIDGTPIGRTATAELLDQIDSPTGPKITLIVGAGGVGKSGVAYELAAALATRNVPYLAIRLDRTEFGTNPLEAGQNLGLRVSPQAALAAACGTKTGILILDQLDAIRWTSQHKAVAWDVCTRIIDAARLHPTIRIVAVCRAFDATDDPRIREWLQTKHLNIKQLVVTPLSDAEIVEILRPRGVDYGALPSSQRSILRVPQNLSIYLRLLKRGSPPTFRTATGLLRQFWEEITLNVGTATANDVRDLLDASVSYLDRNDSTTLPGNLLSRWPDARRWLCSSGVLSVVQKERYAFSHQSHLDYVTADRLLLRLQMASQSLVQWLTGHDQSLFRRGQLRQILVLMRDDDRLLFLREVGEVLRHPKVRFHIKHLTMQFLGDLDDPTDEELDFAHRISDEGSVPYRRDLLLFHRQAPWFDGLVRRGVIARWLHSTDETLQARAVRLLNTHAEARGDAVAALIAALPKQDQLSKAASVLFWHHPEKLSESLFDLYCKLVRHNAAAARYVNVKEVAKEAPRRAIVLIKLIISNAMRTAFRGDAETEIVASQRAMLREDGTPSVADLLAGEAALAWTTLFPLIRAFERVARKASRRKNWQFRSNFQWVKLLLDRVLTRSGAVLVRSRPAAMWKKIDLILSSGSMHECRLALRVAESGPDSWADGIFSHLANRPQLLTCGRRKRASIYGAHRTIPARRCLRRFSACASEAACSGVARAIRRSADKREIDWFKRSHEWLLLPSGTVRTIEDHDYRYRTLFATQYLLLDALRSPLLGRDDVGWLGVLERRFGITKNMFKEPPTSWGGFVTSPIPDERAMRMSTRNWLKLIRRPSHRRSGNPRQVGKDLMVESTTEIFASQLGRVAKMLPSHGIRICRALNASSETQFVHAIVSALSDKPPERAPAEWRPATHEELEAVLQLCKPLLAHANIARAAAWLLQHHAGLNWSDDAMRLLAEIALRHPDPRPSEDDVTRNESRQAALNSARGVSALATASLLFENNDRAAQLDEIIEGLAHDPHPAVRSGATGISVALLNVDRGRAVRHFVAVHDHLSDAVLDGHSFDQFLSYTIIDYLSELKPIVDRELRSADPEIVENGAQWLVCIWINTGKHSEQIGDCLAGTLSHRLGVAKNLTHHLRLGRGDQSAVDVLARLFNDEHEKVRREAALVFWHDKFFEHPLARDCIRAFAYSKAIAEHTDAVFHGLHDTTVALTGFAEEIGLIVDRIVATGKGDGQVPFVHHLPDVLLRLYEQSESSRETRVRCLDIWDGALENDLAHGVLAKIDS